MARQVLSFCLTLFLSNDLSTKALPNQPENVGSKNNLEFRNSSSDRFFLSGELKRWGAATNEAKRQGISLAGFYHTSAWKEYWKEVIEEQLLLMDGRRPVNFGNPQSKYPLSSQSVTKAFARNLHQKSGPIYWTNRYWAGVLDYVNFLYMNVAGEDKKDFYKIEKLVKDLKLKREEKLRLNFNETVSRTKYGHNATIALTQRANLSSGESSTTMAMRDYCVKEKEAGRKAFVFYLHNKGSSAVRVEGKTGACAGGSGGPVASWREIMNTFNLEFPSICMRALLDGYSTCGMEYQDAHYSGNFFWANCDHIASLPQLYNRFDSWSVEYYPFNISRDDSSNRVFAENCGYSVHKCRNVNHYDHECHRSTYRDKIVGYVKDPILPGNPVGTSGSKFHKQGKTNPISKADISLNRMREKEWVKQECGKLRQKPYEEQAFWRDHEKFPFKRNRQSDFDMGLD